MPSAGRGLHDTCLRVPRQLLPHAGMNGLPLQVAGLKERLSQLAQTPQEDSNILFWILRGHSCQEARHLPAASEGNGKRPREVILDNIIQTGVHKFLPAWQLASFRPAPRNLPVVEAAGAAHLWDCPARHVVAGPPVSGHQDRNSP